MTGITKIDQRKILAETMKRMTLFFGGVALLLGAIYVLATYGTVTVFIGLIGIAVFAAIFSGIYHDTKNDYMLGKFK